MLISKLKNNQIVNAIRSKQPIRLTTYAMLDSTEHTLKEILSNILAFYGKEILMEAAYTGIKELAINAVKANMKRVVFEKNGLNINNPENAQQGHLLFKKRLVAGQMEDFAREAKAMNLCVTIEFFLDTDYFMIEIKNNSLISLEENRRLREKLAKSMKYEDIIQFYADFADDTEGAGLGMTMITMALKAEGIDPHCFTIFSDEKSTTARLEIPISEDYIPRRKRFNHGSKPLPS